MTRQFTHIERQFSALNRELAKTRSNITKLQRELQTEGSNIQMKLRTIQASINRIDVEYGQEMTKARMNGRPSARLESLGRQKHQKLQEFSSLRNGTERYYRIKTTLEQEFRKLRAIEQQGMQMQAQFG